MRREALHEPDHAPLWSQNSEAETYAALSRDLETDVIIVGAGITGMSAALRLAEAGKRVVVLEAPFNGRESGPEPA